jgi:hypothetical protein
MTEGPFCKGQRNSAEDAPHPKPTWIVVTVVPCLLVVLMWIFQRG